MMRCTCCGRWTVEIITDLDRGRGAGRESFYRVRRGEMVWDEYLSWPAAEEELERLGVLEYLVEIGADA